MKNKIGLNLYWQTIKQLAIPAVVLGVCCLLATVLNMFQPDVARPIYSIERFMRLPMYKFYDGEPTAAAIAPALIVFMYLGPAVFTYMAFKHLNSRPSSDFYHSLAHTRVCGYLSRILAVFTWQYVIIFLTMAVSIITMTAGGIAFDFAFIPKLVLSFMAGSALMVGGIALAMSLTGNLMSNFMMALVILVLPRTLLFIFDRLIIYANFYTFTSISNMGIFLNPVYNIPTAVILDLTGAWEYYGTSETLIHPGAMAYTFVLGIIYLALGLLGMVKRKSELAGNGVQSNLMRHLLCGLIALPFLVLGFFFSVKQGVFFSQPHYMPQQLILFIIIGFLVFITAELFLKRGAKNALKSIPVFVAAAAFAFALVFAENKIALKISETVPGEDEIECISLDNNNAVGDRYKPMYNYNTLLVKEIEFKDEELIRIFRNNLSRMVEGYKSKRNETDFTMAKPSRDVFCEFKLKNGRSIFRNVFLYEDTTEALWEIISANPEYKKFSRTLPATNEIEDFYVYSYEEMDDSFGAELYEKYKSEFCSLPCVTKYDVVNAKNNSIYRLLHRYSYEELNSTIIANYTVKGTHNGYNFKNGYFIDSTVPETAEFYMRAINNAFEEKFFADAAKFKSGKEPEGYWYISAQLINYKNSDAVPVDSVHLVYFNDEIERAMIDLEETAEVIGLIDPQDLSGVSFGSPIMRLEIMFNGTDEYEQSHYEVFARLSQEEANAFVDTYLKNLDR